MNRKLDLAASRVRTALVAAALVASCVAPPERPPAEPSGEPEATWEATADGGATRVLEGRLDEPKSSVPEPELWPYRGIEGELIRVRLESDDFDPYLSVSVQLDDGAWLELDNDDDSGEGKSATLELELPFDARYVLVAGSADARGGEYTLVLETSPPLELTASPGTRRALLVAAEDYPGSGQDLSGPANDLELMRRVLVEELGFEDENIVELRNARATRRNLIKGFQEHLALARGQEPAVFYYSGHGLRTRGNEGLVGDADVETDGRDEALYLADGSILLDDELGFLIDRLPSERKLVVLDSCFAGTGSRGSDRGYSKRVDLESLGSLLWKPKRFLVEGTTAPPTRRLDGVLLESDEPTDHVLLASSKQDLESWTLPANEERPSASAFTLTLTELLREATPESTFDDLMEEVAVQTDDLVFSEHGEYQEPQAEGIARGEAILQYLGIDTTTEGEVEP